MLRRTLTPALAALALAAAGCGADEEAPGARDDQGQASTATQPPTTGAETATTATTPTIGTEARADRCRTIEAPRPKGEPDERSAPRLRLPRSRDHEAVVRTNCGTFTIALDVRRAQRTASAFAALAREDFFDDTTFHRVVPEFVIQGGDPNGDGTGGPGFQVVEAPPEDVRYAKYTVAMAKSEVDPPGASGSQFYVVTSDRANDVLEPIYAVLGRVTRGRDVVDRIGAVANDPATNQPLEPVVIEDVAIRSARRR